MTNNKVDKVKQSVPRLPFEDQFVFGVAIIEWGESEPSAEFEY